MTGTRAPRLLVAINPTAAFGASLAVGPRVVQQLRERGVHVLAVQESDQMQLRSAVARALDDGDWDALCVVGGDGMVSLAINALADADPDGTLPLGIIPCGTGNDLARGLRLPLGDVSAAVNTMMAALAAGGTRIDVGLATTSEGVLRFAGVVSAGFDARVNERANMLRWPKGRHRYNLALLLELAMLRRIHYSVAVDGVVQEVGASLISVANNSSIGGGMLITPQARLDDGLLDLFVVQPLSRLRFLRLFPKVFTGTHTRLPEVSIRRVRDVQISADGIVAYADGERVGPLPVRIGVIPNGLTVLAPPVRSTDAGQD